MSLVCIRLRDHESLLPFLHDTEEPAVENDQGRKIYEQTSEKDEPMTISPLGLHRVIEPPGVLPQAAWRLDASPVIAPDEVRIRVDRLNLDAASYRQLREAYSADPDKIRRAVLDIITTRGKMQNPVTGSGGMLTGTVDEVGPNSPLGLNPGQRVAILFARSIAAVLPDDLSAELALAVMDVCGAPALTSRVVKQGNVVLIIGAA